MSCWHISLLFRNGRQCGVERIFANARLALRPVQLTMQQAQLAFLGCARDELDCNCRIDICGPVQSHVQIHRKYQLNFVHGLLHAERCHGAETIRRCHSVTASQPDLRKPCIESQNDLSTLKVERWTSVCFTQLLALPIAQIPLKEGNVHRDDSKSCSASITANSCSKTGFQQCAHYCRRSNSAFFQERQSLG